MDTQLQDIIEKIHSEGIKGAEERTRQIIDSAEKQAQETIKRAREQAEGIVKEAGEEAARTKAAGEAALKQASRDLLLAVRTELTTLFGSVQREEIAAALTPDRMADLIAQLVKTWSTSESDGIEVLIGENDRTALEASLQKALSATLAKGVEVRPVKGLTAGFRIGSKDGSSYYDFTDETLADLLAAYLNPRLAELMRNAGRS